MATHSSVPRLARILIHPIKSFDAVEVASADVLPSGALRNDRRWALVDADDRFVNGKRSPLLQRIRSQFDLEHERVDLSFGGDTVSFHLAEDRASLERWLSERLDVAVRLVENREVGFPDDLDSPGPTIVSTATLAAVGAWFPGLSVDEARRRFRANLEIDGVEAFWEDRLYGREGEPLRFRVGDIEFFGTNPCQRCVVPTRDSHTGGVSAEFQKQFATQRESTLPVWAERSRFDHFYRLTVNTKSGSQGGTLSVDDRLVV
ncbi:MAG: MOSC N-terminal beta barrel domain-containing protein [Planctomycetales bacterium]|nr:MOSC N-terminal beta barrel domain-containing protein [Planctomycetales bacterium]